MSFEVIEATMGREWASLRSKCEKTRSTSYPGEFHHSSSSSNIDTMFIIQTHVQVDSLALSTKSKSPSVVPPTQVLLNVPVGHVACAAATQCSHLPLLTLIVAPASCTVKVNSLVPLAPIVVAGFPPQNSMVPAIPPQIERMATFVSWETRATVGSMHVVPVTAVGSTGASPRRASGEGRRGGRAKMVEGRTQRAESAKRERMIAGEDS